MFGLNYFHKKLFVITLLFLLSSGNVFAIVTKCTSTNEGKDYIEAFLTFNITSESSTIPPGIILDKVDGGIYFFSCDLVGPGNRIYFRTVIPQHIKNILLNNGVEIYQSVGVSADEINLTAPVVPDLLTVSSFEDNETSGASILVYAFIARKGNAALKPFDTGVFLLGYHINELGNSVGMPVYARFISTLTSLCPTPKVSISASNGGSVNFDNITPEKIITGDNVSKNFNLNMNLQPDCETGLNISVRFESNNNNLLDNNKLDMDNGLQMQLSNSNGDINYNEPHFVGDLQPSIPLNLSYNATLSHIPGSNIISGPFSKTIRVIVSY